MTPEAYLSPVLPRAAARAALALLIAFPGPAAAGFGGRAGGIVGGAAAAVGSTVSGGTVGSVLFVGASSFLAQDNANLFWDDTLNRLGVGTTAPVSFVDIRGRTNDGGSFINDNTTLMLADAGSANSFLGLGFLSAGGNIIIKATGASFRKMHFGTGADNPTSNFPLTINTDAESVGIVNDSPAKRFVVSPPSSESIAAGAVITADACGTAKIITATGAITTDTTNTFTAPAAANNGCWMNVVNNSTNSVTLDANTNFKTPAGANIILAQYGTAFVQSLGAGNYWICISTGTRQ